MELRNATVLVTGATGFVGSAVARALEARGAKLRVLVRPSSPRTNIDGLNAEVAMGDVRDPAAMERALQGCRYLFHVAADYRLWARDPYDIVRNNVDGVTSIMGAALAAGVERVVYTSSVATLRLSPGGAADESCPLDQDEAIGALQGQQGRCRARGSSGSSPAGTCRRSSSVPRRPSARATCAPTPTGRIIVEAARGRMPAYVDTGLNLVHVDDVAQGHLLALEKGRVGERYILGGQDAPLCELLQTIAGITGRRAPSVRLPIAPLRPLAEVAEMLGRMTGNEPFLTRDALKMASHHMYFSSAKAERELGYSASARPYVSGLQDALDWFGQRGYLR